MKLNNQKKIFIVWGREVMLAKYLADALGAELRQIYYKKIGAYNLPTMVRYIFQATETLLILFEKRPAFVIVQNPPVFAPLTAFLYCKLSGAKLVIDSHTAAFLDDKWKRFYNLFKFAARRAILNGCHNYKNLEILKSWHIKPVISMQFFNPAFDLVKLNQPMRDEKIEQAVKSSDLPIMMVNRFANDDDWETVAKTAELMPEAKFFITGDSREAKKEIKNLPANVFLTGYLAQDEFLKLMWRSSVVLAFSLRPDTVLWSIREIMALGKPFVTTDGEVLKHYFNEVGLFVKSDPRELKNKIIEANAKAAEIKRKIKDFLDEDNKRWDNEIKQYKNFIN
ncbi:MAG: glycosyltransferase [Candidatus Falkowbacteria bacterium]